MPRYSSPLARFGSVLSLVGTLTAQSAPRPADASAELLAHLNAEAATVQQLDVPVVPRTPGTNVSIEVVLGGELEQLVLWPHSLRSDAYQLLVQGADGQTLSTGSEPPATYRGVVVGHPHSQVAASLFGGRLQALARLAPGAAVWSIQPASDFDTGASESATLDLRAASTQLYVVSSSLDALPNGFLCGAPAHAGHAHPGSALSGAGGATPDGSLKFLCEIACDADTEYYAANGSSVPATEADIESVINAVDTIYQADVDIRYELTAILVRTAEPDPYGASGAPNLLNQMEVEWQQNQTAIQRDVAHLFTGRDLNGQIVGLANFTAICSDLIGYGLVQSMATDDFAVRAALSAHELGHNWSAGHCNGAPSGCNIMCAGIGFCGPVDSFAQVSIDAISNFANAVGCLDITSDPPVIGAISPSTEVQALGVGAGADFSILGSALDTVTNVTVNGISLGASFPPGFSIVSEGQIDVDLPLLNTLGPVDLTVVGFSGNDSTRIEIVPNAPPGLQVGEGGAPEVLLSFVPVETTAAGQPGQVHFVWVSPTLVPTTVPGVIDLAIGNGFTELFLFGLPVIDAKGWTKVSVAGAVVPPSTTLYFQSFEYDPVSGTLPTLSSNVAQGLWLF